MTIDPTEYRPAGELLVPRRLRAEGAMATVTPITPGAAVPAPEPEAVEPVEAEVLEAVGTVPTGENRPADRPVSDGYTKRVSSKEAELAEAERLAEIAEDRAEVPDEVVFTERKKTKAAAAKRSERNHPDRVALRDAHARLFMNLFGLVGAFIALAWSTANVQATAALRAEEHSPGWWLAWGVEPLITTSLVTVMGATAYLATRGVVATSRWVTAAKWVPLGYTVALNCWTSMPLAWINHPAVEMLRGLVVHSVGPVVVVLLAHALPVLWGQFVMLDQQSGQTGRDGSDRGKQATWVREDEVDTERGRALLAEMSPAGEVTGYAVRKWARRRGHRVGATLSQWMAQQTQTKHGVAA